MPNLSGFISLLENVCLGGIINECVVHFADGSCTAKALDMTSSVYLETAATVPLEDSVLAFGNLPLFIKYLKAYSGIDIDIKLVDNRLTLKPKGGATLKYLLSEADLIPTYDEEWEGASKVENLLSMFEKELVLTNEAVSEFVNLMKMFGTKSIILSVSKKGFVTITAGDETEHQFTANLGKADFGECSVELPSAPFLAVLSVLDYTENPTIMIGDDKPVVISCGPTSWVLNPISNG